jgi:hypothetical protein
MGGNYFLPNESIIYIYNFFEITLQMKYQW